MFSVYQPAQVQAEELDIINRPVNTSGLTGLLFTTAPYVIPAGTVEVGTSIVSESSIEPKYTSTRYPLSVTFGIDQRSELSLKGSYLTIKDGPTSTAITFRKVGNLEVNYKRNFLARSEDETGGFSAALLTSGYLPLDDTQGKFVDFASHWGLKAGIAVGDEISWQDHILGIYADVSIIGHDLTEKRLSDVYEVINAGLILPISKHRNLQVLIEYTAVFDKDLLSFDGGNYSAVTSGLRLVGESFNLTIGTQFLRKQANGFDNSNKVLAIMSAKF